MAQIIAITNQKGGVSKTTTATALAAGLSLRGFKTLLIDIDPQCNSTDTYQAQVKDTATLYDLLTDQASVQETIQKTQIGDIIASDPLLNMAEQEISHTGKEYKLKEKIEDIVEDYDYIIIDTPPTLGVLLLNALTVATSIIIPVTADRYGLQGLSQLQKSVEAARKYTNPNLKIEGLFLARYNPRTNLSKEVQDGLPKIAQELSTKIFKTTIRESTAAKEAQAMRKSIFQHAPNSTTAQDYSDLINEIVGV